MGEHSPGPWIADGPPHNIHILEAARPHMRVCFMTSDGAAVANANLIAAAPELLAALKAIARQYENQNVNHVDFRVLAKTLADKAIAKAEGRP